MNFIKEIFGLNKPEYYLITVDFNKYGWKRKAIIRSQNHKGNKINNSFTQFIMEVNNKEKILDDAIDVVSEKYPQGTNFKLTKIIKL